jgi:HD-GYP domain-containing protein (c-di-GMP phosphodiesterase class II)
MPNEEAVERMKKMGGTHFDGRVLEAFLGVLGEIVRVQGAHRVSRG